METTENNHESSADAAQVVDALSRQLNIPFDNVQSLYREEFDRIASKARIHQFVSLLAAKNTRRTLRGNI